MTNLFPNRWRKDRPLSLEEFTAEFPDDYACADFLAKQRWKNGFKCPSCGGNRAWRLEARPWLRQCKGVVEAKGGVKKFTGCRRQTSVISGTIMHGTHLPLRKWFLAAFMVATHSNSISALQLQPKIGVGYKTAWLLLHKLRRAMVDPNRTPLEGVIEVDETVIPFRKKSDPEGPKQGKSPIGKLFVAGAVEVHERVYPGRCRLERLHGIDHTHVHRFVDKYTANGSVIITDANAAYNRMPNRLHEVFNLSAEDAPKAHEALPWIHRVFSNFKSWANGTFHGVRDKHIDTYLNEFVFRWNRRRDFQTNVSTMVMLGQKIRKTTYRDIVGDTRKWRHDHQETLLAMVRPDRLEAAWKLAVFEGLDIFDALDDVRASEEKLPYSRRKSKRPILPPRRVGEERNTRRFILPPGLIPMIDGDPPLRHIPLNSKLLIPRRKPRKKLLA